MQLIKHHPIKSLSLIFLSLILVFTLYAVYVPDFLTAGSPQNSEEVDIIVLLNGDKERTEKAVELYQNGYAEKILLTNSTMKPITSEALIKSGVPKSAIVEETEATSTYENATETLEILNENNMDSALVVSSNYHMRRTEFIFDKVFDQSTIKLNYVAVTDTYEPNYWLLTEQSTRTTYRETSKLLFYYLRYGLI